MQSKLLGGLLAAAAMVAFADGARATDLSMILASKSLSWIQQDIELTNNRVTDGGTLVNQAGGTAVVARSDTGDTIRIAADVWHGGYTKQEVRMNGNTISGDAAVVNHAGPLGVVLN